ncbi:MAG: hypothetical protein AB9897_03880 [Anaerolineaceae bacterium]
MKMNVWDILSVLVLVSAVIVIAIVLSIFANPTSSINPFPPPTTVPTIFIPSPTPTLVQLPATWTPVPQVSATPRPSSTPLPTSTPLNIN